MCFPKVKVKHTDGTEPEMRAMTVNYEAYASLDSHLLDVVELGGRVTSYFEDQERAVKRGSRAKAKR